MAKNVARSIYSNSDRERTVLFSILFFLFGVYISCDNKTEISNTAAPLVPEEAKDSLSLHHQYRVPLGSNFMIEMVI